MCISVCQHSICVGCICVSLCVCVSVGYMSVHWMSVSVWGMCMYVCMCRVYECVEGVNMYMHGVYLCVWCACVYVTRNLSCNSVSCQVQTLQSQNVLTLTLRQKVTRKQGRVMVPVRGASREFLYRKDSDCSFWPLNSVTCKHLTSSRP